MDIKHRLGVRKVRKVYCKPEKQYKFKRKSPSKWSFTEHTLHLWIWSQGCHRTPRLQRQWEPGSGSRTGSGQPWGREGLLVTPSYTLAYLRESKFYRKRLWLCLCLSNVWWKSHHILQGVDIFKFPALFRLRKQIEENLHKSRETISWYCQAPQQLQIVMMQTFQRVILSMSGGTKLPLGKTASNSLRGSSPRPIALNMKGVSCERQHNLRESAPVQPG